MTLIHGLRLGAVMALIAAASVHSLPADAARVGVLSNKWWAETATTFNVNVAGHTFTGVDVGTTTPNLGSLQANFDVILLFEDGRFANAPQVGNVVAQFANSGKAVVLGAFYDQDRSDSGPSAAGWGNLETIDPNTTDGIGTPYATRSLNASSIVAHPLTAGVTSLTSALYAGGNRAKAGTTVVALWAQPNAIGQPDPAIAYRVSGPACVIHIGIAPDYPTYPVGGFGGDFYAVWKNAFDFGAAHCQATALPAALTIPTLSSGGLALTALLLAAAGIASRRRFTRQR